MTTKERCSKQVYVGGFFSQCLRIATCTEAGKPYCTQHAPSLVAQRQAKHRAIREAKLQARVAEMDRKILKAAEDIRKLAAYDALLAACEAARAYLPAWPKEQSMTDTVFAQLEAAIALARKEQS